MARIVDRRGLLTATAFGAAGLAGLGLVTNDRMSRAFVDTAEGLTLRAQRLILARRPLAREFATEQISSTFPVNGTSVPSGDAYKRMLETGFADWRLKVHGLVQRPLSLSLPQIRALAARSQITMHACDEGWSAVGAWRGLPLGALLMLAGMMPGARYIVFHCLDRKQENGRFYYESIDLFDAFHPQTILAYDMNGKPLLEAHGAPLRLRVETQIGYKNAKFVDRIEVVSALTSFGDGRGGWWEDFDNAVWYAGQ